MSDDIVDRLRMRAVPIGATDEAADEIERLRAANKALTETIKGMNEVPLYRRGGRQR